MSGWHEGVLERVDIGPGAWVLRRADGTLALLIGAVPAALEGSTVRVRGAPLEGASAAMLGDLVLGVEAIEPASR